MDFRPEDLSPDTATIADADLHANGSSTEVIPTSMPAAHQQDSVLLRLPLELRLKIYDYAMEFYPEPSSEYLAFHQFKSIKSMIYFSGISRQMRCEIHAQFANKTLFVPLAVTKLNKVIPCEALHKYPEALEKGPDEWKDFSLDAPCNFKFWKVVLFLLRRAPGYIKVDLDFEKRGISLQGFKSRGLTSRYGPQVKVELSPMAVQLSKDALVQCVETVANREGFDGFTFRDLHPLLCDLKVAHMGLFGDYRLVHEGMDEEPGA